MKLNHINLPVTDVAQSRAFFEQFFDFYCIEIKGDNALAVLEGKDGFILVLMSEGFNRGETTAFPSAFHIGFLLNSMEKVTAQYHRLQAGGIHLPHAPASMRGIFGFYFRAPGDVLVEVSSGTMIA